jgi:hypothetical protein
VATINIPGQTILAGVPKESPSTQLPGNITAARVQLTDPSGVWATTPGNVKIFGVQASADNFVTFRWLAFIGDPARVEDPTTWTPFGTQARGGGLPWVSLTGTQMVAAAGERVRLSILTDAAIVLGAVITTTP